MIIIDNSKLDEIRNGAESDAVRLPLSVDMFMQARTVFAGTGCDHIVVTQNGEDVAVLADCPCSYLHMYEYGGFIDTEFIDRYDVLFLHGCNENSVELIMAALDKWKGSTLVLVGEDWKYLIEELPDIEGVECIWQDELLAGFYEDVTRDRSFIHVTVGMTGEESMERYENHIMTYDEVMTFTFLFANKKTLGNENPGRNFFVVDANYSNLGLFAIFIKAVCLARYAKKKGFIPVMRIKNEYGKVNLYQDGKGDEIWEKFFNQPEGYSFPDISNSANVFFPPVIYNARILQTLMDEYSKGVELSWPKGVYNDRINEYLETKEKEFLPYPDKTLGVIARGTDYVGTHLHSHARHASMETVGDKIEELLDEWKLEYVFIATEDERYCKYYKERFGDKVYMTDQERYNTNPDEMLAQMYRRKGNYNKGFERGADYILAVYLLSKCDSLLASGGCMAVDESARMKKGEYRNRFVFDLGRN